LDSGLTDLPDTLNQTITNEQDDDNAKLIAKIKIKESKTETNSSEVKTEIEQRDSQDQDQDQDQDQENEECGKIEENMQDEVHEDFV